MSDVTCACLTYSTSETSKYRDIALLNISCIILNKYVEVAGFYQRIENKVDYENR